LFNELVVKYNKAIDEANGGVEGEKKQEDKLPLTEEE